VDILILHGIRDFGSIRRTTLNQSFCLLKYAPQHGYVLHCYGWPVSAAVADRPFDVIVIDTSFLWYRWARPRQIFDQLRIDYDFVRRSPAVKLAFPQDDYDHCAVLDEWLSDWGVHIVFSPLAHHKDVLYPRTATRAQVLECLTGYADAGDAALLSRWRKPFAERSIDVAYRGRDLPKYFGSLGRLKSEIAERFVRALGPATRLRLDISSHAEATIVGDRWLEFLGDAKFILGSISGSSLLDPDGRVQDQVRAYELAHPGATFQEVEAACFPGQDGLREFGALGPRNIEAAMAKTCQILVPSPHWGPMIPGRDFIALEPDCSNVREVIERMSDVDSVQECIEACYRRLVESEECSYESFVARILRSIDRCVDGSDSGDVVDAGRIRRQEPLESLIAELRVTRVLYASQGESEQLLEGWIGRLQTDLSRRSHELSRRRGWRGAMRELLAANEIEDSASNEPPATMPVRTRVYFLARRMRRACRLLSGRAKGLAISATTAWRRDVSGRKSVTMLVADNRIDRRVLLSARALQESGWRVTVVACPFPGPADRDQEEFPEILLVRIAPRRVPPVPILWRAHGSDVQRDWNDVYPLYHHFLSSTLLHPGAVIVAHDLPVLPAAAVAAAEFGARLAYDSHELYPEQHVFSPERAELYRMAEARLILRADLVTTVNESIAEELARRYKISKPAVVWNAPAEPTAGLPIAPSDLLGRKLGIGAERRIVLFQGGLSENRNLENMILAMSYVTAEDAVLVLMGPDGGIRSSLIDLAASAGTLEKKVFVIDAVPQNVLLDYTASADVGIIPYPPVDMNSRLCTPNKLFEYIVAGLPILANDLPELRRFVADNRFGQVHTLGTAREIARAIDRMLASDLDPYREELTRRCHEFTWARQGEHIASLYAGFIAAARA